MTPEYEAMTPGYRAKLRALSVNPPFPWSEDCSAWIEDAYHGLRDLLDEVDRLRLELSNILVERNTETTK